MAEAPEHTTIMFFFEVLWFHFEQVHLSSILLIFFVPKTFHPFCRTIERLSLTSRLPSIGPDCVCTAVLQQSYFIIARPKLVIPNTLSLFPVLDSKLKLVR